MTSGSLHFSKASRFGGSRRRGRDKSGLPHRQLKNGSQNTETHMLQRLVNPGLGSSKAWTILWEKTTFSHCITRSRFRDCSLALTLTCALSLPSPFSPPPSSHPNTLLMLQFCNVIIQGFMLPSLKPSRGHFFKLNEYNCCMIRGLRIKTAK